jgi:alpha-glucosidase
VTWLPTPDGVLAFRRDTAEGSFVCTVNLTAAPLTLPTPGTLLLASTDVEPGAETTELPADSTVWWAV